MYIYYIFMYIISIIYSCIFNVYLVYNKFIFFIYNYIPYKKTFFV